MKKNDNALTVLEEVKYPVSIDDIDEFLSEWAEVPSLDPESGDKEQHKIVKSAHLTAVRFRTTIEKERKRLKAPAIEYGKTVDRIAKEYQEKINPKELELFEQRNKVERYEAEQKQKELDRERERVEAISNKITSLKMIPLDSMGKNSEALTATYESIQIPDEATFQERIDEANMVYTDTMNKLETAIETAKKAEQAEEIQAEEEAKRKAEEAEREAKERAEREAFEKEKREFAEQRKAQERANREQQEEIDRQRKIIEVEERSAREEKERAEREKENTSRTAMAYNESLDFLVKNTTTQQDILDAIIDGDVPHVRWEVDNG